MSISEIASTTINKVKRPVGRSRAIGTLTLLLGAFTTFIFGLGSNPASKSILTFNPTNLTGVIPPHVGELSVPSKATCLILGILIIAVGIEILVRRPAEGLMVRFGGSAVLFVIGLLIWTVRVPGPAPFGVINMTAVLVGSSPLVMVLVFGALSGVMCERAGVVNIAIEGQFIGGAFFGSMIASTTHNFILAAIMGALIGALLGLLLSFLALRYLSDQIIVGVVIVTMLASLSSYLNVQVLSPYPQYNTGDLAPKIAIPLLAKIPILGPVFFNQNGFFYLMIVLVIVISFALFKTRYGLHVRAVGEHPKAAETVGIDVIKIRYFNVVVGGAIAGIGGVAFVASYGQFQPGCTSGLGYIALAALIFGKWRPSGAVVASIIFGVSVYLANNLQTYNVPVRSAILQTFPYLITIGVVAGLIGRVRAPAADGQPYKRD